jgi:hypothetical protein
VLNYAIFFPLRNNLNVRALTCHIIMIIVKRTRDYKAIERVDFEANEITKALVSDCTRYRKVEN